MEYWIIYSLLAGVLIGTGNFYYKVVASNTMSKTRVMWYANIPYLIFPLFYFFVKWFYIPASLLLLLLVAARIIIATEKNLFIIEALKYIESTIFFPVHKIIQIFASFVVGMILFWEYLSLTQIYGLFVGVWVVLLLNSKKNRNIQVNYKKWIWYLLAANLMILFSSTINKYIASIDFDIVTYLFLSGVFGIIYLFIVKKDINIDALKKPDFSEMKIGILNGSLKFFWFVCFLTALSKWPFALVQLAHLSSILIPIILSIIIFKEKINAQKIWAFILFGLAIYLIHLW